MTRRALLLALVALLLGVGAVAGPDPVLALLQRPVADRGTTLVPDHFLRPWDPITLFFESARGPNKPGPEDDPGRFVTLLPAHPGAWRWLDGRTLQFQPADPWPPLARFELRADGLQTTLSTLSAPPVDASPANGATDLAPVEQLLLQFDQPIAPADLARLLRLTVSPLPGFDDSPALSLGPDAFTVKALEGDGPLPGAVVEEEGGYYGDVEVAPPARRYGYGITLQRPIPEGKRVVVHLRGAVDDPGPGPGVLTFSTRAPFLVTGLSCDGGGLLPINAAGLRYDASQGLDCGGGLSLDLRTSTMPATPDPLALRSLLRFEPAVPNLSATATWKSIRVQGDFALDTDYTVHIGPAPLVDTAGRPLAQAGESVAHLRFTARDPFLRLEAGQGIVERRGPQTIPLAARGQTAVDLRLVRVDPLNRDLWPFPREAIGVNEAARPPGPGEEPAPFTRGGVIDEQGLSAALGAMATTGLSLRLPLPGAAEGGGRFGLDLGPVLARMGGADAPGTYLVGVRPLDMGSTRSWMRLQVTDLSLTAVEEDKAVRFGVRALSTGAPVGGARVRVERSGEDGPVALFDGRTGRDGVVTWVVPGDKDGGHSILRVIVQKDDDSLVLAPEELQLEYGEHGWSEGNGRWLDWTGTHVEQRGPAVALVCHSFPERPVYRPEDPVHLRGWARERVAGVLRPRTGKASIRVQTPKGARTLPVELNAQGGWYLKFAEAGLPAGAYGARLLFDSGASCGPADWQMEPYRIPTFEVTLDAKGPVPMDQPFTVALRASAYAGGPVAGQPLRWRVTQLPLAWSPKALPGFLYSSDSRYGGGSAGGSRARFESEGTTDDKGGATLILDPTVEADSRPRSYLVEATVTGEDDQTVTTTRRVEAVPAFALGLKVPRYLENVRAIPAEAVVVGPSGALLPGQTVTLRLRRREWHSRLQASDFSTGEARYSTDVVDVPVSESTFVSGAAPKALPLPVDQAGVYLVELEAHDRIGRASVVTVDLFVAGAGAVSWDKPQAEVFTMNADAAAYEPGAVAKVVVQSPFQQAEGLAIVEAPAGNRYLPFTVKGGQATISVPVEGVYTPRVAVHALLFRGRMAGVAPRGGADPGKPSTVGATTWLTVNPTVHRLNLGLSLPAKATPGQDIPIELRLTDAKGAPTAGEVALWMVDAAVLGLGKEARLDPVPDFITPVWSRLHLRDSRNLAFGRIPFAEMPGGDDGDDEGGDPFEKTTVRRDLRVVPYYEPFLAVPASGKLTVHVKLPDNLTTFKVRAKAAGAGDQRFGHATGQIDVRLPVLVQPVLPRFLRPGDQVELGALARVVEGPGGAGHLAVKSDGLLLDDLDGAAVNLEAGKAVATGLRAIVPPAELDAFGALRVGAVKLTMALRRDADGVSDAIEQEIPLRPDRAVVVERRLLALRPGAAVEVPALSTPALRSARSLLLSDQPAALGLAAAMDRFVAERPLSTGAALASARSLLAGSVLRASLGESEADRALVARILDGLPLVVDATGLVAEWPGQTGRVGLTAQAAGLLTEARAAALPVNEALYERLLRALTETLRSDDRRLLDGEAYGERSAALLALAGAGRLDRAYWAELARTALLSEAEAVANVVLAGVGVGDGPTLSRLGGLLRGGVVLRSQGGVPVYGGLQSQRAGRSPLVLPSEVRDMARIARALRRLDPADPVGSLLMDALVQRGGVEGWGGPDADAEALFALVELLVAPRPWAVQVNGIDTAVPAALLRLPITAEAPVRLLLAKGEAGAALVETRYLPAQPAAEASPRTAGFAISREGWRVVGSAPPAHVELGAGGQTLSFKVGDIVEEHVQIVVPDDRAFVAVSVPLAAGMEPLNAALEGAPPEARPSRSDSARASWVERRDDVVVYTFERLPRGTYDLYQRSRASRPGRYTQPPATVGQIYQPAVSAGSAGAWVEIGR